MLPNGGSQFIRGRGEKKRADWLRFNLLSLFATGKPLKMKTVDARLVEIMIMLIELIKMQDKCRLCVVQ